MRIVILSMLLVAMYVTAYSQTTNGLVASYLFENGSLNDGIGVNHATVSATGVMNTEDRFGNANSAKLFDGDVNSHITLGMASVLKPSVGTVSLWVNINGISSEGFGKVWNPIFLTQNACSKWEVNSLWISMDEMNYVAFSNSASCDDKSTLLSNEPPTFGTWQHLIMTYDNERVRLYVNGQLEKEVTKSFPTVADPNAPVVLGNTLYSEGPRGFKGSIDDVLIYNRVLTDTEIQDIYNVTDPNTTIIAPIYGESPCDGKWSLENANESSLMLSNNGKRITKVGYEGPNTVLVENTLVSREEGWFEFTVENYGEKLPGEEGEIREGTIKLGALINNQEYEFDISADHTIHWIFVNNIATQVFEGDFQPGERLRIKQEVAHLLLQKQTNEGPITIARIKDIQIGETQFYTRLSGLSGVIKDPTMSFSMGCPPYAILNTKKDGGYFQQIDNVLRIQYEQEYAVDPNIEYRDLPYHIYDWQRSVVQSGTIRVYYGMNWNDIALDGLDPATHYTIEFTGNKEEQYALRFKTK